MDTGTVNALVSLVRDYGLPLVLLFGFVGLLIAGKIRLPSETTRLESELTYRETLRVEEREARVEAERRLDDILRVLNDHTDLLREIERDILRGQGGGSAARNAV